MKRMMPRRSGGRLTGLCLLALLMAGRVTADEPPDAASTALGEWWNGHYMLGGDQYRQQLTDAGLSLSMNYVTDSLGNVSGGRDQGFTYTGSLGFNADADLETLFGIPGAHILSTAVWRSGKSLSNHYIGNVFQTQQDYGGQNLRLYCLYWRQMLMDERLEIKLGRIAQGDDFLSRPMNWSYVTNAIDGNPVSIFLNAPMYAYPNATWGAFFKYKPKEETWYAQVGVYGGAKEPPQTRNSAHGLDFSFDYKNAFIIGQAGWTPKLTIGRQDELPGYYSMGAYFVTEHHQAFLQPPTIAGHQVFKNTVHGLWGMYWIIEQMVYTNGVNSKGDLTGVTPWFVVNLAPDQSVNTMPFSFYGGVRCDAVIPSRPDDFLALGYIYGKFSDDLNQSQVRRGIPAQNFESVIELTYRIQVNPWLTFQPDLQYIINPGAAQQYGDALVLGFQSTVEF